MGGLLSNQEEPKTVTIMSLDGSAGDLGHQGPGDVPTVAILEEGHGEAPAPEVVTDQPGLGMQVMFEVKDPVTIPLENHLHVAVAIQDDTPAQMQTLLTTNSSSEILYRGKVPLESEADSNQLNPSVECFPGSSPASDTILYNQMLDATKAGSLAKADLQNWAVNLGVNLKPEATQEQAATPESDDNEAIKMHDLTDSEQIELYLAEHAADEEVDDEHKGGDRKRPAAPIRTGSSTEIKSAKTPRVKPKNGCPKSSHV